MEHIKRIGIFIIAFLMLSSVSQAEKSLLSPQPLEVGSVAPDINLTDQSGNTVSLSSYRGKIVVVHFWASHFESSRLNNNNLGILYDKYKNAHFNNANGFQLVTVSTDSKKSDWINALREDDMPGIHLNDFNTKYTATYRIEHLPTTFLIDQNGVVIGRNMTMAALDAALAQRASSSGVLAITNPQTSYQKDRRDLVTSGTGSYIDSSPTTHSTSTTTLGPTYSTGTYDTGVIRADEQKGRRGTSTGIVTSSPVTTGTVTSTTTTSGVTTSTEGNAIIGYTAEGQAIYKFKPEMKSLQISTPPITQHSSAVSPLAQPATTALPSTYSYSEPANSTIKTIIPQASTETATAIASNKVYRIQVGAFKKFNVHKFKGLAAYGNVQTEDAPKGVKRVLVGVFADPYQAATVLTQVRNNGYPDAFMVEYNNSGDRRVVTKAETLAYIEQSPSVIAQMSTPRTVIPAANTTVPQQMNTGTVVTTSTTTAEPAAQPVGNYVTYNYGNAGYAQPVSDNYVQPAAYGTTTTVQEQPVKLGVSDETYTLFGGQTLANPATTYPAGSSNTWSSGSSGWSGSTSPAWSGSTTTTTDGTMPVFRDPNSPTYYDSHYYPGSGSTSSRTSGSTTTPNTTWYDGSTTVTSEPISRNRTTTEIIRQPYDAPSLEKQAQEEDAADSDLGNAIDKWIDGYDYPASKADEITNKRLRAKQKRQERRQERERRRMERKKKRMAY